ncbi:MAG: ATP-dependent Clp protease adaptor protein ClpS, partial [uncultured Rubrobacteraceae bacterium]
VRGRRIHRDHPEEADGAQVHHRATLQGHPAQRRLHPDGARHQDAPQGHTAHEHAAGSLDHARSPHQGQGRRDQVPQGARRTLPGRLEIRGARRHHRAGL